MVRGLPAEFGSGRALLNPDPDLQHRFVAQTRRERPLLTWKSNCYLGNRYVLSLIETG